MKSNSQRKKLPTDYPTFTFRVTQEQKDQLKKRIVTAQKILNKKVDSEMQKKWRMNDVIIEAISIGLDKLNK